MKYPNIRWNVLSGLHEICKLFERSRLAPVSTTEIWQTSELLMTTFDFLDEPLERLIGDYLYASEIDALRSVRAAYGRASEPGDEEDSIRAYLSGEGFGSIARAACNAMTVMLSNGLPPDPLPVSGDSETER